MGRNDIFDLDRKQCGPEARVCQNNPEHGRLTVVVGGKGLLLGCANKVSKRGEKLALCDYAENPYATLG